MTLRFATIWRFVAGVALAVWPLVPVATASAVADPLNLVTSPLPINLEVKPGNTVTTDIRVMQSNPTTERLQVTLMKFAAYGDTGKPRLLDRAPGDDYFDWVKFDRPVFDAPPSVWQTIKMTIAVPKTAAFGYYYAVVFSRVGDDARQPGHVNSIAGGSAVLVLLDANVPNAKRELTLNSFGATHRIFEFLPATFKVNFKNTGNVHVVPHGNIFILSGKKKVAALDLNDAQGNILPSSNRIFSIDWTDGFPHFEPITEDGKVKLDKKGNQVMHLVWGNGGSGASSVAPHLRMGKYTAHLFAVYDDGQRDVPLESSVDFWVIPWRILLAILGVVLLVGLGVYAAVRGVWRGASRLGSRRRR